LVVSNLYEVIESLMGVVESGQTLPARLTTNELAGRHHVSHVPLANWANSVETSRKLSTELAAWPLAFTDTGAA
jgi:hypothetical protein